MHSHRTHTHLRPHTCARAHAPILAFAHPQAPWHAAGGGSSPWATTIDDNDYFSCQPQNFSGNCPIVKSGRSFVADERCLLGLMGKYLSLGRGTQHLGTCLRFCSNGSGCSTPAARMEVRSATTDATGQSMPWLGRVKLQLNRGPVLK